MIENLITRNRAALHRPGFNSCKTPIPIVYPQRWHRDLLIQLTLDPSVLKIEHGSNYYEGNVLDLLVSDRSSIRRFLAVRDELTAIELPDGAHLIHRSTVLLEPRASACRATWALRQSFVSPSDRLRILIQLENTPHGLPLADLLSHVFASQTEPVDVVLALACQGVLAIDFDEPLSPRTCVRLGNIGGSSTTWFSDAGGAPARCISREVGGRSQALPSPSHDVPAGPRQQAVASKLSDTP